EMGPLQARGRAGRTHRGRPAVARGRGGGGSLNPAPERRQTGRTENERQEVGTGGGANRPGPVAFAVKERKRDYVYREPGSPSTPVGVRHPPARDTRPQP